MELIEESLLGYEAELYQPLISYISAQESGKTPVPYICKWDHYPLHTLAQMALLWEKAGFHQEANELFFLLEKLQKTPSIWTTQEQFDPERSRRALACLPKSSLDSLEKSALDVTFIQSQALDAVLTLSGHKSSLGVIRSQEVEIRAFGPQNKDLCFGIEGRSLNQWTKLSCSPISWLEMTHTMSELGLEISLRIVGDTSPLDFAFYVKAKSCKVCDQIIYPQSLQRCKQKTDEISFDEKMFIQTPNPQALEVIPLAGEGCFWDSEFLILFPLNCLVSSFKFLIRSF